MAHTDMENRDISIRHKESGQERSIRQKDAKIDDIVLDKYIFSSVFNKDIRRVFIYKRAERLGSALYLVAPAFRDVLSLRGHIEAGALALSLAATQPDTSFRQALSRELLTLSAVLSMARASGLLSIMNVQILLSEVHMLLEEISAYEEPRLALVEAPTLAGLAKHAPPVPRQRQLRVKDMEKANKGQDERKSSILSLIKQKGEVSIKDISTIILGVSEKTIQRELQALTVSGNVVKRGERRWSTYSLA